MNDKTKRIKVLDNGPYLVTENIPLFQEKIVADEDGFSMDWEKGKEYDIKSYVSNGKYALCRCGHSETMPFCDGKHDGNGFCNNVVVDRTPYLEGARIYEGEVIDLIDNVKLCAEVRFCDRFDDTWHMTIKSGDDHPDYEAKAIDEANKCAAGRLTIRKNGQLIEPELEKEISVVQDAPLNFKGPLWVKGGIILEDSDNCEYEARNRMTLCRCGESTNMPFCDASHFNCDHMRGLDDEY